MEELNPQEIIEKYIAKLGYEVFEGEEGKTPYRLSVPEDFADKKYPVVLFMHGAGERGNDNELPLRAALPAFVEANEVVRKAIFIIPQCPEEEQWVDTPWWNVNYSSDEVKETWKLKNVVKILAEVVAKYNADADRIYVMGLSMGGYATWDLLTRHGELFAAAMPICGGADPTKADILKEIPIQTFHGDIDDAVPVAGTRNIVKAIKDAGGEKITYTEYTGWGHWVWDRACSEPGIGEWMFSHKLSDRK